MKRWLPLWLGIGGVIAGIAGASGWFSAASCETFSCPSDTSLVLYKVLLAAGVLAVLLALGMSLSRVSRR
jgi:hypothetical protein